LRLLLYFLYGKKLIRNLDGNYNIVRLTVCINN